MIIFFVSYNLHNKQTDQSKTAIFFQISQYLFLPLSLFLSLPLSSSLSSSPYLSNFSSWMCYVQNWLEVCGQFLDFYILGFRISGNLWLPIFMGVGQ